MKQGITVVNLPGWNAGEIRDLDPMDAATTSLVAAGLVALVDSGSDTAVASEAPAAPEPPEPTAREVTSGDEGPAEAPLMVSESQFSKGGRRLKTVPLPDDPSKWPKP